MNWKPLSFSIFFHAILLAIPVSISSVWQVKEVEIFFIKEKQSSEEEPAIKKTQAAAMAKLIEPKVLKKLAPAPGALREKREKKEKQIAVEREKNNEDSFLPQKDVPIPPQKLNSTSVNEEDNENEPKQQEYSEKLPPIKEQMKTDKIVTHEVQKPLSKILPTDKEDAKESQREKPKDFLIPVNLDDKKANKESYKEAPKILKPEEKDSVSPDTKVFGTREGPRFVHREMPVYPVLARRMGKEGKVVLRLTINENGILQNVEVIEKAGYGFTEAAVEAVKKSTFLPAQKDGKPIACQAFLTIKFQLERK